MSAMYQPLQVFFSACQGGLLPLRALGRMGTPDDPVYFKAGDTVPWWIECRWPLNFKLTFVADCETFWQDGNQHVHPLHAEIDSLMLGSGPAEAPIENAIVVGAPTVLNGKPRTRRPRSEKPVQRLAPC